MDIGYLLFLQDLRDATGGMLDDFFLQLSVFGEPFYALLIMSIIYWCVDKATGSFVLMGWGANRLANGFLKITACVYRPWIRDPRVVPVEAALAKATGYSFPSGHTTNAVSVFGGPAMRKELAGTLRAALFTLVLLVGFSRNWLGVHTPQDVLVALVVGFGLMWIASKACAWADEAPGRDTTLAAIGIAAGVALVVYAGLKSYPTEFDAAGNLLVDPKKMAVDSYKNAGWVMGICLGWLLERRTVGFTTDCPLQIKCARAAWGSMAFMAAYFPVTEVIKAFVPGGVGSSVACFVQTLVIVYVVPALMRRVEKDEMQAA